MDNGNDMIAEGSPSFEHLNPPSVIRTVHVGAGMWTEVNKGMMTYQVTKKSATATVNVHTNEVTLESHVLWTVKITKG